MFQLKLLIWYVFRCCVLDFEHGTISWGSNKLLYLFYSKNSGLRSFRQKKNIPWRHAFLTNDTWIWCEKKIGLQLIISLFFLLLALRHKKIVVFIRNLYILSNVRRKLELTFFSSDDTPSCHTTQCLDGRPKLEVERIYKNNYRASADWQ